MTQRFTGWHMATILITFFGIVIAVNLVMARFAVSTFGGTVVDNSYVASQNYNRWLAAADAQARLGWVSKVRLDPARRLALLVSKDGAPLANLTAQGLAIHPLGRTPSIPLTFELSSTGALLSKQALPAGRWRVQITLRRSADTVKLNLPVQ
jgi:nitrogen fixation protein FixH